MRWSKLSYSIKGQLVTLFLGILVFGVLVQLSSLRPVDAPIPTPDWIGTGFIILFLFSPIWLILGSFLGRLYGKIKNRKLSSNI